MTKYGRQFGVPHYKFLGTRPIKIYAHVFYVHCHKNSIVLFAALQNRNMLVCLDLKWRRTDSIFGLKVKGTTFVKK